MLSSSRLKSHIWLHFTAADDEKKVKCLHCGQKLSIANKSTCSLIRHMHKKHPKQHIVRKTHPESKYNLQESKKKDGYFYKKTISIKKQKEIDRLLTGDGRHEYIPPDETLDKVANILGPNCDGYKVQFGSDDVVNVIVVEQQKEETEESAAAEEDPLTLLLPSENEKYEQNLSPPTLPSYPPKSKIYFASPTRKGKQRSQALVNELRRSIKEKNVAIAKYYDSKKKQEEELHFLKKKKLQLEILEKERNVFKQLD